MKRKVYLMKLGRASHVVSFHDGVKTHRDGSPFYDIQVFRNEQKARNLLAKLLAEGYEERGVLE